MTPIPFIPLVLEPHSMGLQGEFAGWVLTPVVYDERMHRSLTLLTDGPERPSRPNSDLTGRLIWCVQAPEWFGCEPPEVLGTVLCDTLAAAVRYIRHRQAMRAIGNN